MDTMTLAQLTQEVGLPIGIFLLCAWLTVYIVKKMSGTIDALKSSMEVFTSRVRDEHDRSSEEHKAIMEQHKGITETLGRINGYK